MKWGIRRYQNEDGTLTAAGKKRYGRETKSVENSAEKKKSKYRLKLEQKYRDKGMSDEEAEKAASRRIRGEIIVGAAIVGIAAYKLADSGELNRLVAKGRALVTGIPPEWKTDVSLSQNMSADEIFEKVVKKINPEYDSEGLKKVGSFANCRRCTFNYELRRRGFDVKATKTIGGSGQHIVGLYNATHEKSYFTDLFKNDDRVLEYINKFDEKFFVPNEIKLSSGNKSDRAKDLMNFLSSQPNGSRGELCMSWTVGSGHSMAYEIINSKPVIFDCQTSTMYTDYDKISDFVEYVDKIGYFRLDNVNLNNDFLLRWAKNA